MSSKVYAIILVLLTLSFSKAAASAIGVISPKTDSVYQAGSTLYISYAFIDVDTVNIEVYTPANGGTWEIVVDSLPAIPGHQIPIKNLQAPDWAHYQIRISDFNQNADTAYSGEFTILNPSDPTLFMEVLEESTEVGAVINIKWDISPSVDSVVFEGFDPWRKRWIRQDYNFSTRDSTLKLNTDAGLMGGKHYLRLYDVNNPDKYSNTDSIIFTDNVFGGLASLYPEPGSENVDVLLEHDTLACTFRMYFKEFIDIVPNKTIELYNDAQGLVGTISSNDTSRVKILKDDFGEPTILAIYPPLPFLQSTNYYVLVDPGTVNDVYGNPFNGISSPTTWSFSTEELYDFGGTVAYAGSKSGSLILTLFEQADINNGINEAPSYFSVHENPEYPFNFSLGAPYDGTFGIFGFIDLNGNMRSDPGEPSGLLENLEMKSKDIRKLAFIIHEGDNQDDVFVLNQDRSYWGNNEPFTYNTFVKSYYVGDWQTDYTPIVSDAYKLDDLMWGVNFKLKETGKDDLAGSILSAGINVHLEFNFPDNLTINYIAAGGIINSGKLLKKRLILDLQVIDPLESENGDLGSSLGFIISCSPDHSGGNDAHGSFFYGSTYMKEIKPIVSSESNAIGVRINGKDGVENRLVALIPDQYLIQNYTQFNAGNLPENSAGFIGYIPDLNNQDYAVEYASSTINNKFDVDGDGKFNTMYKVVLSNNNWSEHDLLFRYNIATSGQALSTDGLSFYYNANSNAIEFSRRQNGLQIYDMTGKLIFVSHSETRHFKLKTRLIRGIYFIRSGSDANAKHTNKLIVP